MKKEITKYTSSMEEITVEEAVSDFFDGDWDSRSWEGTEGYIDSYIEEFQEISDKEADHLKAEIKKEFDRRVNILRQKEINKLKDKESILKWIKISLIDDWPDEGDVGYILSEEEILDLILENGRK